MRSRLVVAADPAAEDAVQMVLRQRNQPVEALPADRADQPLAERIGLGRPDWRLEHTQADAVDHAIQLAREDAVAVVEEEAGAVVVVDGLPQFAGSTTRRWAGS